MKVQDLEFKKFITAAAITEKVHALANQINHDYKDKTPVFLPILNGSFMFAADLLKEVKGFVPGVVCKNFILFGHIQHRTT
jgi:hypoxanthine phosphoribosyltransferase